MFTTTMQRIDLVAYNIDKMLHMVMVDQPIQLHLSGFAPGQPVTIEAVYTPPEGLFRAQATFLTDKNGDVDVASQTPLDGSYSTMDAMGLFWSMKLDEAATSSCDNRVTFTVVQGEHARSEVTIERLFIAPGVTKKFVRERGLYGTLCLPPGEGPHPALLVLSGSSGGLPLFMAQMFASHGYAALALAYFRYEDLPAHLLSIPLEYVETALEWMQEQQSIQADRIGVYGLSKGGELALLLGATFPQIKAVVGIVPSAFVFQGIGDNPAMAKPQSSWSFHGQDLPYVPFKFTREYGQAMQQSMQLHTPVALTPLHLYSIEQAGAAIREQATIQVERTQGPILLISGQDDQLWPSGMLADTVMERLEQHHFPYPYRHIKYQGAGHRMAIPYQPTTIEAGAAGSVTLLFGGNAQSQAAAMQDAWAETLEFLASALSH